MKSDQELRSLKRGLKVLSLLNQVEAISITDLARHFELPRTTAERILLTLVAEGYVQRVAGDKRYRLSGKVCSLADGFSDDCRVVEVATPLLFRITHRIGWPLAIATPCEDSMVLRSTTDPATTLWLARRRIGARIPVLNSSSGLVAYTYADADQRAGMAAAVADSPDPTNRERLADRRGTELLIGPVRERGFAFQPPPNNTPEQSIAVPIFVEGRYVASLLMIYMTRALHSATVITEFAPRLKKLAEQIGRATTTREPLNDADLAFPDLMGRTGTPVARAA